MRLYIERMTGKGRGVVRTFFYEEESNEHTFGQSVHGRGGGAVRSSGRGVGLVREAEAGAGAPGGTRGGERVGPGRLF